MPVEGLAGWKVFLSYSCEVLADESIELPAV